MSVPSATRSLHAMATEPHLEVLRQAAAGTLPDRVERGSAVPVDIVGELVISGYLAGIDASSSGGPCILEPRITTAGREHLRILEERAKAASLLGRLRKLLPLAAKWVFGVVAAVLAAYLTGLWIA